MVNTRKNEYGYDKGQPIFPQFLKISGVKAGTDTANSLKCVLEELAERFDIKEVPSDQEAIKAEIEHELIKRFPKVFKGPSEDFLVKQRKYFAIRFAMKLHNARRKREKRRLRKEPAKQLRSKKVVAYGNREHSNGLSLVQPHRIRGADADHPIDLSMSDDLDTDDECQFELRYRVEDSPAPISKVTVKLENSDIAGGCVIAGKARIGKDFIHNFLASCNPTMEKYAQGFRDSGITSKDHLRQLASFGPVSPRRRDFLKSVLEKVKKPASDLQVAILDNRICTYFGNA